MKDIRLILSILSFILAIILTINYCIISNIILMYISIIFCCISLSLLICEIVVIFRKIPVREHVNLQYYPV